MSDVRLSNGSPPRERVDARLADHTKPPVCRNLFGGGGAADAAEFQRDCTEQLRELERASRDKWNYDFALDEPLPPGQYVWEAVDHRSVPDFYSRAPRGADPERAAGRVANAHRDCRDSRKRPSTEQQDGAGESKRANSDAEETNLSPDESPSAEQTPRKSQPNT